MYTKFNIIIRFFTARLFLLSLLFISLNGYSQPGAELGIIAGGGYYTGEYNPDTHLKQMQHCIGGFYRFNLNDRYTLRFNGMVSKIETKEKSFRNGGIVLPAFKTPVVDLSGVFEFNFRSFLVPKTDKSSWWSPYLFIGAGMMSVNEKIEAAIPFGWGIKFNVWRQFALGVEWSGRKMFSDVLDNVEDMWNTQESNFIFNKDTFFVFGVTVSYRFPLNPFCRGYE